jgi:hypothetical protein
MYLCRLCQTAHLPLAYRDHSRDFSCSYFPFLEHLALLSLWHAILPSITDPTQKCNFPTKLFISLKNELTLFRQSSFYSSTAVPFTLYCNLFAGLSPHSGLKGKELVLLFFVFLTLNRILEFSKSLDKNDVNLLQCLVKFTCKNIWLLELSYLVKGEFKFSISFYQRIFHKICTLYSYCKICQHKVFIIFLYYF